MITVLVSGTRILVADASDQQYFIERVLSSLS
jgi:hypothetical protein